MRIAYGVDTDFILSRNSAYLKTLLRDTPIYTQLLDEFPDADLRALRIE